MRPGGMADTEIHRYELMEERRSGERRHDHAPARFERRGSRSLVGAPAVRRVFPVGEGEAVAGVEARDRAYKAALALSDLAAALVVAGLVPWAFGVAVAVPGLLVVGLVVLVAAEMIGCYDAVVMRRSTLDEAPDLAQLAAIGTFTAWLLAAPGLGHAGVLAAFGGLLLALVLLRTGARASVRRRFAPERCLVIGDPTVAGHIRRKVDASAANARVVAMLGLRPSESGRDLGGVAGLREVVAREGVERVILAPVSTDAADTLELVRMAKAVGVRVSVLPRLFDVVGSAVEFEEIDGVTFLAVRRFGLSRGERAVKRAFDLAGSGLALAAFAPLMLAAALAIRLDGPGPILFRQVRVGRGGRHFCIAKFRTMVPDAEARKDALRHLTPPSGLFKLPEDPRVTRVGAFLRRTSLDELPQLLNVVRGDMSLVGPRPLVVDEDAQVLGLDRQRLHLTPGMTGPWQVLGSSRAPMEEMVGIDYLYVSNWTLWSDVKLMLRTVPFMVARRSM
jgi:exopolysaccharide biosynthesis polyprenyl glycosylphosphotransferase